MRAQHYEELLDIYYESLSSLLTKSGGNPTEQFPKSSLLKELELYSRYGLIMSLYLVPLILTKTDELADLEQVAESFNEDPNAAISQVYKKSKASDSRLKENFEDACKYGYV